MSKPWDILRPVQRQIQLAMLLSGTSVVLGLASLALLALVLGHLIQHPHVWPWLPMALATASLATSLLLRLSAFNQSHYAAFRLETILRTNMAQHLAQVSLGHIQQYGAGALAKVMQDDIKALHIFVADSTPLYARATVAPLCTLLILVWLDWRLASGAVAVLLLGLGVLGLAMRNTGPMQRRYNAARERVNAAIVEFVQAMPVVRSFDTGHATFSRYQQALECYRKVLNDWYQQAGFTARYSFAVLNPLPTLIVLLGLGGWLATQGTLNFATWAAVLLLGAGMAEAVMPLMALHNLVARAKLSIGRIQQVMALPALPPPVQARLPASNAIDFESVSFGYGADPLSDDELALCDVTFHAAPGTITALVGSSGAGKTTIARLIPRFWDVNAGSIRIGGTDIRDMTTETLMAQVAFVFQESFLLADSVANNIRLGVPEATMEEVVAAARAAQAHSFIEKLPEGYATPVGERGGLLSGGQRQRITIARALLQNRPILVLDEPTAFADPENEAAVMKALSALMRNKTVMMVTHRLSTIREADQILVLERGQLVENGQHAELVTQSGVYARLWQNHEQAQRWALKRQPAALGDDDAKENKR
ncbi:ABC transporter ATP-binding protein [Halomonas llamarensis]|uniref:ABC transporter ATP-binding protein/permease n=1 Tax=Halomonas llamarensis TaxID=2945104 RepID=A0ABT0SRR4_9GAMM|nr:ABC transporter ATP-binding protein [Halomonas llamarensis]MCL7930510.1 ABC transporter ATP-binding protein/permease [Halomonas llamarensis]